MQPAGFFRPKLGQIFLSISVVPYFSHPVTFLLSRIGTKKSRKNGRFGGLAGKPYEGFLLSRRERGSFLFWGFFFGCFFNLRIFCRDRECISPHPGYTHRARDIHSGIHPWPHRACIPYPTSIFGCNSSCSSQVLNAMAKPTNASKIANGLIIIQISTPA